MNHLKISVPEAVSIVLIIVVAHSLVSLPKVLISATYSATLLNLIYVGIIAFFLTLLIVRLYKNFSGSDIIEISNFVGGPIFQKVMGIIFISYFIFSSSVLLRNFCEGLKAVYYPATNIFFIMLTFVVVLTISTRYNFANIAKINLLILPIVFISILFVFFANSGNLHFDNVLPVFGNGFFATFVTGLGNIGAFSGIVLLYFIPPYLKAPDKFKSIAMISIGLSIVFLLVCVANILLIFRFLLHTDEIMPLYSAARSIDFGTFFERLESFLLLIWIFGMASYFSVVLSLSLGIFQKITNIKDTKPLIVPFSTLFLCVGLFPQNYAVSKFFESSVYPWLVICVGFILPTCILIIANFKKRKKNRLGVIEE